MSSEHERKNGKHPRKPKDRNPQYDPALVPKTGALGRHGEPISLAEELALESSRGFRKNGNDEHSDRDADEDDCPYRRELQRLSIRELIAEARNIGEYSSGSDDDREKLIFRIVKQRIRQSGMMFAEGTLEILPDGFGFIRNSDNSYLSGSDDVYVSPSQVHRFGMRKGSTVSGSIRPPKENERYFALLRVAAINGEEPGRQITKRHFEDMTPTHSEKRLPLDIAGSSRSSPEARLVDLLAPIGFGQRGLIVGPPRSGKTRLLTELARALFAKTTEIEGFFLALAKPREEIRELRRALDGLNLECVATTSEESPARHLQLSEIVLEKAKRHVEYGKHAVVFLDSISDFLDAWSREDEEREGLAAFRPGPRTLERTKKFMYSAKCFEEGGSLTLIATLSCAVGSPQEERIRAELLGTGQFEITLDGELAKKRLFPAIDFGKTATKREELFYSYEMYHRIVLLRGVLEKKTREDVLTFLREEMSRFDHNEDFLLDFGKNHEKLF